MLFSFLLFAFLTFNMDKTTEISAKNNFRKPENGKKERVYGFHGFHGKSESSAISILYGLPLIIGVPFLVVFIGYARLKPIHNCSRCNEVIGKFGDVVPCYCVCKSTF